jgi:hypothetical protein
MPSSQKRRARRALPEPVKDRRPERRGYGGPSLRRRTVREDPWDPFRHLVPFVSEHSGLPPDIDPVFLQRLLPDLNVNLYETLDSGELSLMHLGTKMPLFRDDRRRGQPLRDVPAPPSFTFPSPLLAW